MVVFTNISHRLNINTATYFRALPNQPMSRTLAIGLRSCLRATRAKLFASSPRRSHRPTRGSPVQTRSFNQESSAERLAEPHGSQSFGRSGDILCGGGCGRRGAVRCGSCRNAGNRIAGTRCRGLHALCDGLSPAPAPLQFRKTDSLAFGGRSDVRAGQDNALHRRGHRAPN